MSSATESRRRVLLTNDDGVAAPGIASLYRAFCERHEVVVVAPSREQSGIGHAFTFQYTSRNQT